MKKILSSILLIFLPSLLFASVIEFNSNSISQKLGVKDGNSEYTLKVVTENDRVTTLLYYYDNLIKTIISKTQKNKLVEEVYENGLIITKTYQDDYLVQYKDNEITINYSYDGNLLLTKATIKNGKRVDFSRFYYDDDNILISKLTENQNNFTYSAFDQQNNLFFYNGEGENFKEINSHGTHLASTTYKGEQQLSKLLVDKNEIGDLILTTKENNIINKEFYNNKGSLIKKEATNLSGELQSSIIYLYDESSLLIFEEINQYIKNEIDNSIIEEKKEKKYYNDGTLYKVVKFENSIKISSYVYNVENRKIETLFKNNSPYCTITYSLDGKKIIDIVYKEESND